ncbi:protein THALLO-like [Mercurialis annua]|uniref:protein THALLO-like n=1 Tax=Mercurialis annua TaxID=3986 RepID=UPI00215DDA81|nr:protein THALLO-like [Mercurialis annua]
MTAVHKQRDAIPLVINDDDVDSSDDREEGTEKKVSATTGFITGHLEVQPVFHYEDINANDNDDDGDDIEDEDDGDDSALDTQLAAKSHFNHTT